MANKKLFSNKSASVAKSADTVNSAGGKAYSQSAENALAQAAMTGMFSDGFYTSAEKQLSEVVRLAKTVSPEFLAKVAVYSRHHGFLKDMPAVLLAVLSITDTAEGKPYFKAAFRDVVSNGKMLRNFVQVMRSGTVGRKSLGSAPKRMVQEWLNNASDEYLFAQTVGNDPSLVDVIKMVHPRPADKKRDNFYAYLLGKKHDARSLPKVVKDFEKFKKTSADKRVLPDVPFQMVSSCNLTADEWRTLAQNGGVQFTMMNLNTFARNDLYKDKSFCKLVKERFANEDLVRKSKLYPYQIFQAHRNVVDVPDSVKDALNDAMDLSIANIPEFSGNIVVAYDQSGSMSSPVSGGFSHKGGRVSCGEVAVLLAAALKRKNPDTLVLAFDTEAHAKKVSARDSIMHNIESMTYPGGGTDCSSPLRYLNTQKIKADLVFIISDMESWVDRQYYHSTGVQAAWSTFKGKNKNSKLVCINVAASTTTVQSVDGKDVLNIGGFSDRIFDVANAFLEASGSSDFWSKKISETVTLKM